MDFLYHIVPPKLNGKYLYPLNELKNKYPLLYKLGIKKYSGRINVTNIIIPSLNCKWNDVIHLTAVHPSIIKKSYNKAGGKMKKLKWFKISPKELGKNNLTIYLYKYKKDVSKMNSTDQFEEFSISKLKHCNDIPKRTFEYYTNEIESGRKPLLFHYIPHILYKGKIEISNLEVIEV